MKLSRGTIGYLGVTLGLLAGGSAVVLVAAPDRRAGWLAGGVAAWLVQAPAYWVLVGRLERGLDATGPWLAGIGARFGGLALLAVGSWALGLPMGPVALAYGIAMVAFLILEATWLAVSGPRGTPADGGRSGRLGPGDATTEYDATTDGDVTTK
ncbi:MAG: hypothetical protein KAJ67_06280 [Gemmatimonadetes bacterium]|nr:hypothetical protein [Gemmatimonadota bacterium]